MKKITATLLAATILTLWTSPGNAADDDYAAFDREASRLYLQAKGLADGRTAAPIQRTYSTSIEDNIGTSTAFDPTPYFSPILAPGLKAKPSDRTILAMRALAQALPAGGGGDTSHALIHAIRDRAELICGSDGGANPPDPGFLPVRIRIHNYFSPAVLDETRAYLRNNPGISDRAKNEISILIRDLEKLLGVGQPAPGRKIAGSANTPIPTLISQIENQRENLLKGITADPLSASNALNQNVADLFVHFGLPANQPSPNGALPIQTLKQLLSALHAEGLLKDKDHKEFLKTLDRVNPNDRTKDVLLRDFLKHVFALAQEQLEKGLAWAKVATQSPEGQSEFIQDWIRSSNLLRLSQWIEKLTPKAAYEPASQGSRCGTLRVVENEEQLNRLATGMKDILAVISNRPIEVTRKTPFGGLISTTPMTEGSHAVILCRNMQRPCGSAAISKEEGERLKKLNGKLVRLDVAQDGYKLQAAAAEPARAPTSVKRIPLEKNLSVTEIKDKTSGVDAKSIGVKAANYFELNRFLGDKRTQPGMAIPFSYYVDFIKACGADKMIADMLKNPKVYSDPAFRSRQLAEIRYQIQKSRAPIDLVYILRKEAEARFKGTDGVLKRLRFRSSSNSEDLQWFSGAGMYESVGVSSKDTDTNREIDAKLGEAVKAIWASVWSDAAFEGREEVGIDHSTVAMGVLVHPSYGDEDANGVALTGSDPSVAGLYKVSANFGDLAVTNPEKGALPEVYEGQRDTKIVAGKDDYRNFKRRSNVQYDAPVLNAAEAEDLRAMVKKVHDHFGQAMEIEWKLMHDPKNPAKRFIQVKQARPYRPKGRG